MEAKKALNADHAWVIEEKLKDIPHGWIQWKGTNVCMDVYCKCGSQFHIDADFAYHVKCPHCGTVYSCNGHIELVELEQEPDTCVVTEETNDF
jgi:hypothetical protein